MSDITRWTEADASDMLQTTHASVTSHRGLISDVVPVEGPRDVLSGADFLMTVFILNCLAKPAIIALGVPSNIISCLVFWRQGLKDRMNVCLFALSSVDLSLLLVATVYGLGFYLEQSDRTKWGDLYFYIQAYLTGVNHALRTASGFVTMVIAIERCLCVMVPLKAASLLKTRSMVLVLIGIVCLTQLAFFTFPATYVVARNNNSTSEILLTKSVLFMENRLFFSVWEGIIMMSIVPAVTFATVSLATALTVVKLRAAARWRMQTSSSSDEGRVLALTKMLLVISCVYIVITIPWVIVFLGTLTITGFTLRGQYCNSLMTSLAVIHYLPYVNCSLNFFVFFNMSRRFKKDLVALFSCSLKDTSKI